MSANNEDLKKVTQRRRPHGPGARMMPGEKAKDFKGSIGKLVRFMGQFKAALVLAITFAIGSAAFNIVGPKVRSQATTELFEGLVAKVGGTGGIDFDAIAGIIASITAAASNTANTLLFFIAFLLFSRVPLFFLKSSPTLLPVFF